ncbi:MAG: PD-(D/E)XK nuclease family protein [Peptoniphilaceae bacterium]|nr:PD-(D/E)XK nuclease family protein [Peptoniphilaceae bacterium]MDY6019245.1 PD-(D/E)XK nuclease family protein [Anaerococcus sp.]
MINIAISRYTKDTSKYIYRQIEEDVDKREKSFLIVPEQYTLQSDVDFIDHVKYTTVMDAKVLSFNSLSQFIIDKIGKSPYEPLTNTGKIMLLTKVLSDINDDLELFKNAYKNIDFVENIAQLISNIKDYNFDQEFFLSIDKQDFDPVLKIKFKEIEKIYKAYTKESSNLYEDSEDKLAYVISRLKECDFLKESNFYFDKFDSLSDLRLEFISSLLKLGAKVSFGLTFDGRYFNNPQEYNLSIYDETKRFIRRLRDIAPVNIIDLEKDLKRSGDINYLLDNFESYNPKVYKEDVKNIYVLKSTSTTSEVENIALMIKNSVAKGKRYRDFSIVMTNKDEYENQIIRIFDRYDLPYFLDQSRKMIDNHIIKSFMAGLRIVLFNFKKEDILTFVRSGIYDFGENSYQKIISFQNYLENRKIKNVMILNDKYFSLDKDFYKNDVDLLKEKEKELFEVNTIRNKLIDLVKPLYELSKENNTALAFAREIFNLFDKEGFKIAIEAYQENLEENGDLAHVEENKQMWDKFMNILDQLVKVLAESYTSFDRVYRLIKAAVENTNIGIIPPSKDHLLVTDFSRDRVSDTKYKIILGMNDVFFPSNSKEEFLINKIEKDKLKEKGIDLKIYQINKDDRQLLNLQRMIGSSEKIYFSYSLSNKENVAINMSTSLIDIIKLFEKLKVKDLSILSYEKKKYSKDMITRLFMDKIWKMIRREPISDEDKKLTKNFIEYTKLDNTFNIFKRGLFYSNDKENLSKSNRLGLYSKNRWNVSEMETYSKCPYKYFMTYGIKPNVIDPYDVAYIEIGNIVHSNIENFSKRIKEMDKIDLPDQLMEKLIYEDYKKAIEKNLDKLRRNDAKNKYILAKIFDNTKQNSKQILRQLALGKFKIDGLEEKFAKDGLYPEVYVDENNYLEGRIDRLDRYENYVRIIDYKTGAKEIRIYNILNGLDLQLVVYMLSVKKKRTEEGLEELIPVGAFYLPLKDELVNIKEQYSKELVLASFEDKFKMEGFIVKINEHILQMMDKDFDKKSAVFALRKADENIFTEEENLLLEKFVIDLIANHIKEIKNGKIDLRPIKYAESTYECSACIYRGICKIDYTIDQARFIELDKNKKIDDLKGKEND